jgi:hypothetical protein
MFSPTSVLDWGNAVVGNVTGPMGSNMGGLGPATQSWDGGSFPETVGTTVDAAIDRDAFTIVSDDELERADNTSLAWNGTRWAPAVFVNSNDAYFAGHFNAPNMPTSQPQFGDNLLGALAPSGGDNGPPTITLTFARALSYVAFEVSSATNANFTAELVAFNAQGIKIGTYQVADTGGGGICAGLSQKPPQPCNDAPLIQFYDPTVSIASVELIMLNDDSGMYIDELMVAPIPEPVSGGLAGLGLLLTLWAAKRKPLSSWHRSVSAAID